MKKIKYLVVLVALIFMVNGFAVSDEANKTRLNAPVTPQEKAEPIPPGAPVGSIWHRLGQRYIGFKRTIAEHRASMKRTLDIWKLEKEIRKSNQSSGTPQNSQKQP